MVLPAATATAAASTSASSSITTASGSHILPALHHALCRLSIATPRLIPSPPTQPRRASVAIILRVRPSPCDDEYLSRQYDADGLPLPGSDVDRILGHSGLGFSTTSTDASITTTAASQVGLGSPSSRSIRNHSCSSSPLSPLPLPESAAGLHSTLSSFFSLPWVKRGEPEIFYIKRATRPTDKWSAHVAFPGGRRDETDEDALYTAMRETWEEVGLDLADRDFLHVGQLDDREITSSLGKRLLMVLSPFGKSCHPVEKIGRYLHDPVPCYHNARKFSFKRRPSPIIQSCSRQRSPRLTGYLSRTCTLRDQSGASCPSIFPCV